MPALGQIDDLIRGWAREWQPEQPVNADCDVFNVLWDVVERYYESNHYGIRPNFERVLGNMTALASWLSPPPFGDPLVRVVRDGAPVGALNWLFDPDDPNASRVHVLKQQTFLLERLAKHMRECCRRLDPEHPVLSDYREFFRVLHEHFDLGIYNLNYDTVARTAWPAAFCGFDPYGRFDPLDIIRRRDWGFLYHLHGSVHQSITSYPERIAWKRDLHDAFTDQVDVAPAMAQEFRWTPLTTVVAGGFKLDQLTADPYQTFYSAIVRHVQEADAILIAGYGFGDFHINKALQNRFEGTEDEAPFPQVVIVTQSRPECRLTAFHQSHQFWAWEMTHTLKTRFSTGTELPSESTRRVAEFIDHGTFETDMANRVAIWHRGFHDATSFVDKIVERISIQR